GSTASPGRRRWSIITTAPSSPATVGLTAPPASLPWYPRRAVLGASGPGLTAFRVAPSIPARRGLQTAVAGGRPHGPREPEPLRDRAAAIRHGRGEDRPRRRHARGAPQPQAPARGLDPHPHGRRLGEGLRGLPRPAQHRARSGQGGDPLPPQGDPGRGEGP